MKLSEIYLKAAKRVDRYRNTFGCDAIQVVVRKAGGNSCDFKRARNRFAEYFDPKPTSRDYLRAWFSRLMAIRTAEERQHCVTSLLMMAAIAESEGD